MIHTAVLLAATTLLLPRVCAGVPVAPSYGTTFSLAFDLWNADEDLVTQSLQAQDPVAKKLIVTYSSPAGSYTQLIRGDTNELFLYYPLNGSNWCGAFSYPGFTASPFSLAGLPFTGPAVVRGTPVDHFRVSSQGGSYITGAYLNVTGAAPLRLSSPSQRQTYDFTAFDNTTTPPASLFDVPAYCRAGSAVRLAALPLAVAAAVATPASAPFSTPWAAMAMALDPVAASAAYSLLPRFTPSARYASPKSLPASLDHSPLATPVRNQGSCGSCWAFSSTAAVEVAVALKAAQGKPMPSWISPQYLLDCCGPDYNASGLIPTKGCFGGWPATALGFLTQKGAVLEADYAYAGVNGAICADGTAKVNLVKGYAVIAPRDIQGIQQAVADNGAVVSIVQILGDFLTYTGGVYDNPQCTGATLSHGVTIVGWGTDQGSGKDYWLVKNSFGRAWGIGGYFKIRRGVDRCGIESWAVTPVAA